MLAKPEFIEELGIKLPKEQEMKIRFFSSKAKIKYLHNKDNHVVLVNTKYLIKKEIT